jgi:hypothetical protein
MIFDILGELGSAPPWLYRAWGILLSKSYREATSRQYSKMSPFFRVLDILLSFACFAGEIVLLVYLSGLIISG